MKQFSEKQIEFLRKSDKWLNFAWGSVRSGKSWINNYRFLDYCINGPKGDLIIVGKTERTIRRNILNPIASVIGSDFKYNIATGECLVGNRKCAVRGGNDERSSEKIQGDTFAGCYADEITLLPESFWKMLLSRLSVQGAQLFGTTNTDSPYHWFKTEYLDNDELDIYQQQFTLDDNPYLPAQYVKNLKDSMSGLWYDRYISGLFVLADGVVYDMYDESKHVDDFEDREYKHNIISVDYGITNPCTFHRIQWDNSSKYYITHEYYYDFNVTKKQKTDSELADDFDIFVGNLKPDSVIVDPSATSFIAELRKRQYYVRLAVNDVLPGISFMSGLLKNDKILIHVRCENLRKEFATYIWDEKAQLKGEDKPVKKNDHCLDSIRYGFYTVVRRPTPIMM